MPLLNSSAVARFTILSLLFVASLLFSGLCQAQTLLDYRLLDGYGLTDEAPVDKEKPTLFVAEQPDTFSNVFKPTQSEKPVKAVDFTKEMVVGIVLPSTTKPPKLSISRVFVQDSTLTVRYIRLRDTTLTNNPLPTARQPMLLLAIPKQNVLKTRILQNGRLIQTLKKRDDEQ